LWWWGLFKILFSLVLSLVVAVGGGAELAAGNGAAAGVAATAGGEKEMAGSSGTEAKQFYLLMGLFAGDSQIPPQQWKACDAKGLSHKISVADPFLGLPIRSQIP
jgi:hypothetical protein